MSHDWKTKTAIRDGSSSGRFVVDWAEAEDFLHAAYEMTAARVVTGGLPDPMDDRTEADRCVCSHPWTDHTTWCDSSGCPCRFTTAPPLDGETEDCPTCMRPMLVPQRGDHDYGLRLAAPAPLDGLTVERLARALYKVDGHGLMAECLDDAAAILAALREGDTP